MKAKTLIPLGVAALVAGSLTIGILSARDGENSPASTDRLTSQSGQTHVVLAQHHDMIEQMQTNAEPAMLQLMNNDPMWQMMRTESWARLDEQHHADVNRMLGKGSP